jgi:hypothetical protein
LYSLPTEHLAAARKFDDLPVVPPGFSNLRQVTASPDDPDYLPGMSRGGAWHTMHVWGGMEGPFVADLQRLDVPYFHPREDICYWSGGKKRQKRRKCFPGYVFVAGTDEELARAMESHWKLRLIRSSFAARLLESLEALECLIGEKVPFQFHAGLLSDGVRVRVMAGNLLGMIGYVLGRRKNGRKLYIQFDGLCSSVSTEIDPELLERIS